MKRLLIFLLLLPSLAWGEEPLLLSRMNPYILGGGVAAAAYSFACTSATSTANTSGVLCEDFDNPTQTDCNTDDGLYCRAAWSATTDGSPNFAYAGATGKAAFVDSCSDAADADARVFDEGTTETFYWYFQIKITTGFDIDTGRRELVKLKTSNAGANWGVFNLYDAGSTMHFHIEFVSGSAAYAASAITVGTLYHVWIKTVRGSGANAKLTMQFATTATRPYTWANIEDGSVPDQAAYISDGTLTTYPDSFNLTSATNGSTYCTAHWVDNIVISTSEIGSNP